MRARDASEKGCWHYLKWRFVGGVQKYNTPSTGVEATISNKQQINYHHPSYPNPIIQYLYSTLKTFQVASSARLFDPQCTVLLQFLCMHL